MQRYLCDVIKKHFIFPYLKKNQKHKKKIKKKTKTKNEKKTKAKKQMKKKRTRTWITTQHIRKHHKKGLETPTSRSACVHPMESPSGSRDRRHYW
jgi:hypothetical protein